MRRRFKANKRRDRRYFSKNASRVNKRNFNASPMRGGYRF